MRVAKGCPVCEDDVIGTAETGYYCKTCNIIFSKRHVIFKHVAKQVQALVHKHFSGYEVKEERPERPRQSVPAQEEPAAPVKNERPVRTPARVQEPKPAPIIRHKGPSSLEGLIAPVTATKKPKPRKKSAKKRVKKKAVKKKLGKKVKRPIKKSAKKPAKKTVKRKSIKKTPKKSIKRKSVKKAVKKKPGKKRSASSGRLSKRQ